MKFLEKVKQFFNNQKIVSEAKSILNDPFPCNDCIVGTSCTKPCDKLERDPKKMMKLFEDHQCCIDCGGKTLLEGPTGGMSVNVMCSNCNHEYNLAFPLFVERIGKFQ